MPFNEGVGNEKKQLIAKFFLKYAENLLDFSLPLNVSIFKALQSAHIIVPKGNTFLPNVLSVSRSRLTLKRF
jgi:hypothetical protein